MLSKVVILGLTIVIGAVVWANQPAQPKPADTVTAPATRPARAATRPTTRPTTRPVHRDIAVQEFERLWREEKYSVLDVRTKAEFDTGHIPGAINIDVSDAQFEKKVAALKKDRPYLVNCRSGARSTRACLKMTGLGFKELYNLDGGIVAWQKAKREVSRE